MRARIEAGAFEIRRAQRIALAGENVNIEVVSPHRRAHRDREDRKYAANSRNVAHFQRWS